MCIKGEFLLDLEKLSLVLAKFMFDLHDAFKPPPPLFVGLFLHELRQAGSPSPLKTNEKKKKKNEKDNNTRKK